MGIYTGTVKSKKLEGIPELPWVVRERLTLVNSEPRLALTNYRHSNIIPIRFGQTPFSRLTQEIFMRMRVLRVRDLEESMPILDSLDGYFDRRDEDIADRLGHAEREELATFVGGSITQTLAKTGEILDDFHGVDIYKNRLASLKQYMGLVIREQGITRPDNSQTEI